MDNREIILIVDDTPANLWVLGELLKKEYEVRVATNGLEAMEIVKSISPDLILLDIIMPGLDGYEVCRRLKQNPDFRMIPVIFISALGMPDQKIQAFQEGAVDYITKPFQAEEVMARVRTHIELSKLKDLKREIAERKLFEKRMIQMQRLEAIGTLAGGIAHDFNNILSPIMALAELLMMDLPAGSPEYDRAAEIHEAGRRAANLVGQILSFSRPQEHHKMPVRIQLILKEVVKLSRATIPSNIEIIHSIQNDCGPVLADPTNIHQVAMNLITNAYHAVEKEGGTISIQLTQTVLSSEELAGCNLTPGKYALFSVSDTGHGISPENLEKIFEPYFTTKEQGKGTGLGLSVVFGIVKDHGGLVQVSSQVGRGSAFKIYLPLIEGPEKAASPEEAVTNIQGSERILLVDDEESIVRIVKSMLERLGYQVLGQTGSLEALAAFKADPKAIDLVITDMNMPKMTGDQLAAELMAVRPGLPVILCSGYSEKFEKLRSENKEIKGFIMKPIVRADLAALVRKVLDSNGENSHYR